MSTPAVASVAPITPAAPAAPAAPSASAAVTAANAPVAPAAPATNVTQISDWMTGLDEGKRGFATNKGWKNPGEVLDSYQNMEKLLGAPQDKIIKLPADDDKDGWNSVYSRLGRPQTPKDYGIEVPKEGGDPAFAEWAGKNFHELGLSKAQGAGLAAKWNEFAGAAKAAADAATIQKLQQGQDGLKKEWGAAYDQNVKLASRAAREFGVPKDTIDKIEAAIGFDGVMKLFSSIGSKVGESSFVTGDNSNGALTPDQAKDQISALKGDRDWIKKYASGDAAARRHMERLQQMAFQGEHTI